MSKTKVCKNCGQRKLLEEFHQDRKRQDGRFTICKECINKNNKEKRKVSKYPPAGVTSKVCTKCNKLKSLDHFNNESGGKYGKNPHCKECISKKRNDPQEKEKRRKREAAPKNIPSNVLSKVCTGCGEDKLFSKFNKHPSGKYGYNPKCTTCKRKEINAYTHELSTPTENEYGMTCVSCREWKQWKDFPIDKQKKYGIRNKCKECGRLEAKKRREHMATLPWVIPQKLTCTKCKKEKPSDSFYTAVGRKFNKSNVCKTCVKEYNKTPHAQKLRRQADNKYNNTPEGKLTSLWRGVLKRVLTEAQLVKKESSKDMLGYSKEELEEHLNNGKYTMEEYYGGGYDVDHIIPVNYFIKQAMGKSEEEQYTWMRKCNDLRNLRVWPTGPNIQKGYKIDKALIKKHGIEDLLTLD